MLDPEQMDDLGEETDKRYAELEMALLIMLGSHLGRLRSYSPIEINAVGNDLRVEAYGTIQQALPAIRESLRADVTGALLENGLTEVTGEQVALWTPRIAQGAEVRAAQVFTETAAALTTGNQVMFSDVQQKYYQAAQAAAAKVRSGAANAKNAVSQAVANLAHEGITYSTYTRSDGTIVHVPVDVGVRREIQTHTSQALGAQVIEIARMLGENLVEVSSHPGARPSHATWHGHIYMLNGSSEKYPNFYQRTMATDGPYADWVRGYGGYNCKHTLRIYREGEEQRWSPNPEAGTGYTNDEIYALKQKQRALENQVRKDKRAADTMEACDMDATKERAKVRERQRQIRELVKENPVLRREAWREQVTRSRASDMRKPPTRPMQLYTSPKIPDKDRIPAPKEFFDLVTNRIVQAGGTWQLADESWLRHLDEQQAGATSIGDAAIFRQNPTKSELLEEERHIWQFQHGVYTNLGHKEQELRREIDAKEYLISVADEYTIPEVETRMTQLQLGKYRRELEEYEKDNR